MFAHLVVLVDGDGFFAGEVGEDRGGGDVGGVGYFADADIVEAALQEEFQGGVAIARRVAAFLRSRRVGFLVVVSAAMRTTLARKM
ncbi:hypothetical protein [Corynebacterium sp. CNJ-954]|uniref:hypothetical protein n=1 Tax=Corynebacterium sp. CNJ-954 TaxID=1904962 RepID=UPI002101C5D0|nr:hypothetical protein [Corynebacterium sp. CNJ-954]